jgi:creatinine amidohydrolase/Fe(II)-dependent formamide hydrolase-like protein
MIRLLHYEKLNATELAELDREHTLALMALGPLEVHGPHLPVGSDGLVALELQRRIIRRVHGWRPETAFLILPPLFVGADVLPLPGSLEVDSRTLYRLLVAIGQSLADQGFRTLVLTDNHGGPRHQIAVEKAVRRLWRKHDFALVAPFNRFYRRMIQADADLQVSTGTTPGSCGDDADAHAGTNETSLLLVVAPGLILPLWKTLPATAVPEDAAIRRLLGAAAGVARLFRARYLPGDLEHLGSVLAWLGMDPMPSYMGDPPAANLEAGEAMLEAHVDQALDLLQEAWDGQPPFNRPPLWGLRFIEGIP